MRKHLTGALAGLTVAGGALAAPAQAGHDDGDAIVAGVAGFAIGAALGYGARGYYRPYGYYGYAPPAYAPYPPYGYGYYPPPPPPPPYYHGGYRRCHTVTFVDPYYGPVRERRCW